MRFESPNKYFPDDGKIFKRVSDGVMIFNPRGQFKSLVLGIIEKDVYGFPMRTPIQDKIENYIEVNE